MSELTRRWSLVVSEETDTALRQFLATQGGGRKGDLSRFVEEAVRNRILELAASDAKAANATRPAADVVAAVEEALAWARAQ
jgi:hypothetical protein